MAEDNAPDKDQKTLDPTAKRLEDAYKKGQVPISRDLNNFIFLLGCLFICLFVLPEAFKKIGALFATFVGMPGAMRIETQAQFTHLFGSLVLKIIEAVWVPFGILFVVALSVGLSQTYKGISIENIQPKISRISIKAGFKRLFNFQSLLDTLKAILKIVLLAAFFYFIFKEQAKYLTLWLWASPYEYLELFRSLTIKLLSLILTGYAFLAGFDFWYQRFHFKQNLRMTTQELKEEQKELEGDPTIRGRIREIQRKRARDRMLLKVKTATVVVTNPTHYSVALFWEEQQDEAPSVIAKGVDYLALRIREIAGDNKVPIVENAPVARSLYDSVEIDQQIPPEYYKVVAEVIRTAMKIRRHQF